MTADGIHPEILLRRASLGEKIRLCPGGARAMLESAQELNLYPEADMGKLALECIDIPAAVRDEDGFSVLWSLIGRHCEVGNTDMQQRMSAFVADIPAGMSGGAFRNYLRDNPKLLLEFLKFPKSEETETPVDFISDMLQPKHGLRYYQLAAARKIAGHLEGGKRCAMYHAPTGSGKTRTAMSVVTRHFRVHGPTAVLWLAASTELVGQAAEAFRAAWQHHGDFPCMMSIWQGASPHFKPEHEPTRNNMLIAGLQKVALACGNDPDIPQKLQGIVSLVVFDEAHQSVAPTYRRLIDGVMEEGNCRLLGLSATPGRLDEQGTEELAALYGGKKVTIETQHGLNPIEYLVQEGCLAKANFHHIDVESGALMSPAGSGDFSADDLGKIGADMRRNAEIAAITADAIKGGHTRILVFCPSVDSARMCAAMLKSLHGVEKSDMISSDTPKEARAGILRRYAESWDDSPHVIFNYGILTTGFDAPRTSAAVIARPTNSVSLYSQMVGRAIRGVQSGGNKEADIYTVQDPQIPEFGRVVAAFNNWNHQWKEKQND